MTTSQTHNFNLDVAEIIEQAFDMVGGDHTSGTELKKARIAMNLLLIDMQNRGHPLAELTKKTFTTSEGVTEYTLDSDVSDVINVVLTRDGLDTPMDRIPLMEYHDLPNKSQSGRPVQYTTKRGRDSVTMYIYQAPENSTDVIDYWCVTRIEDAGAYSNTPDVNIRYMPALTFGLAYFLSLRRDGFDPNKRAELLSNYVSSLDLAFTEDRERTSFTITPHPYHRRRR